MTDTHDTGAGMAAPIDCDDAGQDIGSGAVSIVAWPADWAAQLAPMLRRGQARTIGAYRLTMPMDGGIIIDGPRGSTVSISAHEAGGDSWIKVRHAAAKWIRSDVAGLT